MAEADSPFAGMDLREVLRMSDTDLAAAVRPPDDEVAGAIRAQAVQYIIERLDTWPSPPGRQDATTAQQEPLDLSAAALFAFRRQQGWTQTQMGVRLGVTGQAVSDLERGKARLTSRLEDGVRALLAGGAREEKTHD